MSHQFSLLRSVAPAALCSALAFGLGFNAAHSKPQAASGTDISPRIVRQLTAEQQAKLLARPSFTTNSAVAVLGPSPADSKDSGVRGAVVFIQSESPDSAVRVRASITGLKPNSKHGFHIHTLGDLTKGCMSAGGHWNPFEAAHGACPLPQPAHVTCSHSAGAPSDAAAARHAGDLGNLVSDALGNCNVEIEDALLTLHGPLSIVGRSVIM